MALEHGKEEGEAETKHTLNARYYFWPCSPIIN